jgi:hypothetical protein
MGALSSDMLATDLAYHLVRRGVSTLTILFEFLHNWIMLTIIGGFSGSSHSRRKGRING